MVDVLDDQRTATRFRVLVEIAERQPAVSQEEIAEAIGITSQAVSRYIRDLVDDELVAKDGRSRYRITTEGVDWLLTQAGDVRRFADRVTEDVLGGVSEDAAIATGDIEEGETVTLTMREGLLHAAPDEAGPATATATTAGSAGSVVGVTNFEGVIDMEPGTVTVVQVPPVRDDRTAGPDDPALRDACDTADMVLTAGVEAVVALEAIDEEPATTFAAGEVAAAAAARGLDVTVVASADHVGRVTDPLRDAGAAYSVTGS
jgi:putative transcriptional regulator